MKHLKTFENFDLDEIQRSKQQTLDNLDYQEDPDFKEDDGCDDCDEESDELPEEITLEKKKSKGLPPWLKKGKKKGEEKEEKEEKDDKKDDKKPSGKGLTAAQKKLPAGLQKAILAKKK